MLTFSQNYACEDCGISIEELSPRMFSFNNPYGACPSCTGLGIAAACQIPTSSCRTRRLSILGGAITASGWNNVRGDTISRMYFEALAEKVPFQSLIAPIRDLSGRGAATVILYGTGGEKLTLHYDQAAGQAARSYQPFEGIAANLERRYRETQSPAMRAESSKSA